MGRLDGLGPLTRRPHPQGVHRVTHVVHPHHMGAALHRQQFAAAEGTDDARDRAAWLTIARVLLNLDETITRE